MMHTDGSSCQYTDSKCSVVFVFFFFIIYGRCMARQKQTKGCWNLELSGALDF